MSRNARFLVLFAALFGGPLTAGAAELFPPPATNAFATVVVVQGENLLNAFLANSNRVQAAFNHGLLSLTQASNVPAAWRTLVQTNDVVGIKVFSQPGPLSGTRPAVVAAIVRGLLAAGLPPDHVVIWDKRAEDLRAAGYFQLGAMLGVRVAAAVETGYDKNTYYLPESPVTGALVWGDLEFGETGPDIGKKSYVTRLLTHNFTKIISVAPLINNNTAGLCGQFYSLCLGSVDNTRRFEDNPDRLAVVLPEIYALPSVGDRVTLLVTDALLAQYQGGPASYLQYSTELDQIWLSRDPVALDTLGLKELARERAAAGAPPQPANFQIYTNAVLLQLGINDPSRIRVVKVE